MNKLDRIFVIVVAAAIVVLGIIFASVAGYALWGIYTGNAITRF